MKRSPRRLRHWKQKFNKGAQFIWSKNTTYAGVQYMAGDVVPDGLLHDTKARRFWEANRIQLSGYDEPNVVTGRVECENVEPESENVEPESENVEPESENVECAEPENVEPESETVEGDDSWLDGAAEGEE